MNKGVTSKNLQLEAGLAHLSKSTVRGILNKNGYRCLQTRCKGLLSKEDIKRRKEFARNTILYQDTVRKKNICFYLNGSSFVHKTHPADQAKAPDATIWRKTNEGLKQGLTSKGKKARVESRVVHFIVCISYGKGMCFCEQYKKMNGVHLAVFIRRNFKKIIRKSCNPAGNIFVQDGDPSQNSKVATKEWQKRKLKLLSIPPRSPNINPIENMFNLFDRKLKSDAIEQSIMHETYEQFSARVQNTLENYPIPEMDKIIDTIPKKMHQIINCNGSRLSY